MNNAFGAALRNKTFCSATWLLSPSGYSAEVMAQTGWDALIVDLQHGVQDYHSMVACLQAMAAHKVTPLVRVPSNEPGIIGKALDAGVHGVICPMVNTREEAEALVRACRYPPLGQRSNGPVRAGMYTRGAAYQSVANSQVSVIAMIETLSGVENLDAILAVPGIDSLYVGPSDLSLSMGGPALLDHEDERFLAIYRDLLRKAAARGVAAGIHAATPAYARRMRELGFGWASVGTDSAFMAMASAAQRQALRAEAG